jgi:hypothetical protein
MTADGGSDADRRRQELVREIGIQRDNIKTSIVTVGRSVEKLGGGAAMAVLRHEQTLRAVLTGGALLFVVLRWRRQWRWRQRLGALKWFRLAFQLARTL